MLFVSYGSWCLSCSLICTRCVAPMLSAQYWLHSVLTDILLRHKQRGHSMPSLDRYSGYFHEIQPYASNNLRLAKSSESGVWHIKIREMWTTKSSECPRSYVQNKHPQLGPFDHQAAGKVFSLGMPFSRRLETLISLISVRVEVCWLFVHSVAV